MFARMRALRARPSVVGRASAVHQRRSFEIVNLYEAQQAALAEKRGAPPPLFRDAAEDGAVGSQRGPSEHSFYQITATARNYDHDSFDTGVKLLHHKSVRITDGKIEVNETNNGTTDERNWRAVSSRWLRDNCACKSCRNPETGQRNISVLDDSIDHTVVDMAAMEGHITVTFGDDHQVHVNLHDLLRRNDARQISLREGYQYPDFWRSGFGTDPPPTAHYQGASDNSDIREALSLLRQWGFCFVKGIPATPEASQQFLERIGPIRNTHYGGFYDFTSDLSSKDTAYTSEALEPHTDNTYFTEPAGLQALHMLSHTDGSGGESTLVDGFACAAALCVAHPEHYQMLKTTGVYAHASGNEGISIQPDTAYPTFSHHPDLWHLTQVRWNNADRAGLALGLEDVDKWYDAASKFNALLNSPQYQYKFQLEPGTMLLFDNWRVLHGRLAFTGKRRMCGGYINRDDWISKWKMTNFSKDDIQASTVT